MDRTLVASILAMVVWACSNFAQVGEPQTVDESAVILASPAEQPEFDEDCLYAHLGELHMQRDGEKLVATGKVDVAECVQHVEDDLYAQEIDYQDTVRIFVEFSCRDVDPAKYDGMTLGAFRNLGDTRCRIVKTRTERLKREREILTHPGKTMPS